MASRTVFFLGLGTALQFRYAQAHTQVFDDILTAHTDPPYCSSWYAADTDFVACCTYSDTLTTGLGPGHVSSPACYASASTCTGVAPAMYEWTVIDGSISIAC